ncbi:MAG: alpha amylase C-terminal domain-containing protein, partial [Oscillospiraceae bacterium]|nr:alpha amylase C-terminal domain-containing protein [Oscillospiraceae bacterium]
GKEHLEAIEFLQELNRTAFQVNPDVVMVAEESTAWPLVTKPTDVTGPNGIGGLGFNLKWNMGWMNDMCHYLKMDPWFRQGNHKDLTFSMFYAFSENYILPLSHDEVVHMKGSVLGKMPGDQWQKLAGVRGFYGYTMAHPGKKLSFMGVELGTEQEWHFEDQLDWGVLQNEGNAKLHRYIKDINHFYQSSPELWEVDFSWEGFQWLVPDDNQNNVVVFLRRDKSGNELLCAINFNPNTYEDYRFGCPPVKEYVEVFNSDAEIYGGTGVVNAKPCKVEWTPSHGQESSVSIRIPPFGAVFLRGQGKLRAKPQPKKAPAAEAGETVKKPAAKKASARKAAPKASVPASESPAEVKAPVRTRTRKAAGKTEEAAGKAAPKTEETAAPKKRGRAAKKAGDAPAEKKAPSRTRKKTSSAAE